MAFNRRKMLQGAGIAGAAAATGAGVDPMLSGNTAGFQTGKEEMNDDAARFGDPRSENNATANSLGE